MLLPVHRSLESIAAGDAALGERLWRLVTLQDYNTWVPLLATGLLGLAAGVVGVFMVLRRRALVGDVVGHAALPGIVIAFLLMERFAPGSGRYVPGLLFGTRNRPGGSGLCTADRPLLARPVRRALAIVLSLFYGGGTVLLSIAQQMDGAGPAGLRDYLYGRTAALVGVDIAISSVMAIVVSAVVVLLHRNLAVLCFDEGFAASIGLPVRSLDVLLLTLAACVAIVGMKTVGLVLVVALLIIPAAAARFWTDDIRRMTLIAGLIGGGSGIAGVAASSLASRIAAGPTVVLMGTFVFVLSLLFGARRVSSGVGASNGNCDSVRRGRTFSVAATKPSSPLTGTRLRWRP
ncbi:MAG: iron chelate uptake ABC transporter family permease subunit [Planctomycetaceae bacterium]